MSGSPRYDRIGLNYSVFRRTEPTWLAAIDQSLGDAQRVLNVGAGTGSYEELGRELVALEPSRVMIEQRVPDAAPAVQGVAEALPFADDSFDAVMGVLTMHHWTDRAAGLAEAARVAPRQAFTVYEPESTQQFWLMDYFPEIATSDLELNAPSPADIGEVLDVTEVHTLWVPRDCTDRFGTADWARPAEYLDPGRQAAVSFLALLDPAARARGTERLRADLESGAWHERYRELAGLDRVDFGYRLVLSRRPN